MRQQGVRIDIIVVYPKSKSPSESKRHGNSFPVTNSFSMKPFTCGCS